MTKLNNMCKVCGQTPCNCTSVTEAGVGNRMSDMSVGSPKVVYKNGRAVGEIGIDHDASPGNGPYYMKHYETNTSYSGYDTKKEALAELKHCVEQMNEQGVAEGSEELYQQAIRKYVQRVANNYLGGGNAHLYGAGNFDSEMFGVDTKQAEQDFDKLFPQYVKQLQDKQQGVAEGLPKAQDGRYNPDGSKKQAWHKDPRWQQHAKDLENDPKNIYGGVGKKKVKEQGVAEGWKDKLGAAALAAAPIIGGLGANMVAPNVTVHGHQAQLATGSIPDNAKLVTDDNGNKVYVWKSFPIKNSPGNTTGQLVYKPAEPVKEQGVAEGEQPTKYRATVEYGPTAADAHFVTVTANSTEEAEAKVQAWCKKKGVRNPMITINGADKPVDEGLGDIYKGVKRSLKGKPHPDEVAARHFGRVLGNANVGNKEEADKETKRFNKVQALNKGRKTLPDQLEETENGKERKRNAMWAQITSYEKRAKETTNDIKRDHLMKMADELRAKLPTTDEEKLNESLAALEEAIAGDVGHQIKALYKKIYDQGDDAIEFMYYDSPIFAQYWDEYEGDLDSIIAEVDPSELQVILDELQSAAEDQGLAEGAYDQYDLGTDDDDYEDQDEGFYVCIGSEDQGGFVGMVIKDGGKWREVSVAGTAPHNWGSGYMGYLSPEDVMQWLRKDYGRYSEVEGPFDDEESAREYASQQYSLDEAEQQKGADYRDPPEADYGDDYQDMVSRVKKLAGMGPLKTVYDPAKRVYRNVPTAVQPKK